MLRVGGPSLAPLRGRAAFIPAVGLPPVAGLADVEHRAAPHAAAPERAVPDGAGHRPGTGAACAWGGRCGTGCAWPSADGPRPGNGAPGRRVRPRAGEDLHAAPWGRARVPVPVVVCGSGAAHREGGADIPGRPAAWEVHIICSYATPRGETPPVGGPFAPPRSPLTAILHRGENALRVSAPGESSHRPDVRCSCPARSIFA